MTSIFYPKVELLNWIWLDNFLFPKIIQTYKYRYNGESTFFQLAAREKELQEVWDQDKVTEIKGPNQRYWKILREMVKVETAAAKERDGFHKEADGAVDSWSGADISQWGKLEGLFVFEPLLVFLDSTTGLVRRGNGNLDRPKTDGVSLTWNETIQPECVRFQRSSVPSFLQKGARNRTINFQTINFSHKFGKGSQLNTTFSRLPIRTAEASSEAQYDSVTGFYAKTFLT